jgi:rod shape-determining protein MreC
MRHFFTTKIRIILILSVLLAIGLAVITGLTNVNLPGMLVQGIVTPLRTGVSKLTDQAEQMYGYIFHYEALAAENAALKEELSQMKDDARLADTLKRENDRLRALNELKTTHEDYVLVDAYIIAWGSNDWTSTLTINRGTNVGIEAGMCAITENGEVIGLVSEAGPNYAIVKTVLDSSLGISATITSSGYNGMVQGNYVEGREDMLRMNYLPSNAVIRTGDQVVTSGSTVYPRDLILGYVVDADFDDTGVAKFALLRPAADINTLEQVFVLTDYNAG